MKKLLSEGHAVIGIDNFYSSEKWKSELFSDNPNYEFIEHDVTNNLIEVVEQARIFKEIGMVHEVYNLACPASPPRYINLSLETIKINVDGTINALELAKKYDATMLHTSTSEVYGDPLVHPQEEAYRGNVNTVGPRSCYDEGKRISETICYEYKRLFNIKVKVVRLFNTYGPYMDPNDGRVITNFIIQALNGENLTVYEQGQQTRSFQYIDDLLSAIDKVMNTSTEFWGPVNLGNPVEFTIKELAELVLQKIETTSKISYIEQDKNNPYNSKHDPQQRKPDITLAREILSWDPKIKLEEGLTKTIDYYKSISELKNKLFVNLQHS